MTEKKILTPQEAFNLALNDTNVRIRQVGQGPLCPGLSYGIQKGVESVFVDPNDPNGAACPFPRHSDEEWEVVTKEELQDEYRRDFEQADAALVRGGGVSIEPLR